MALSVPLTASPWLLLQEAKPPTEIDFANMDGRKGSELTGIGQEEPAERQDGI